MRVHNQQNKQHKVIQNAVAVGFTKSVAGDCKYTFHFGKRFQRKGAKTQRRKGRNKLSVCLKVIIFTFSTLLLLYVFA